MGIIIVSMIYNLRRSPAQQLAAIISAPKTAALNVVCGGGECRGNRGGEAKHCTRNRFPGYRLRTNKPGDEKINESPLFLPERGEGRGQAQKMLLFRLFLPLVLPICPKPQYH